MRTEQHRRRGSTFRKAGYFLCEFELAEKEFCENLPKRLRELMVLLAANECAQGVEQRRKRPGARTFENLKDHRGSWINKLFRRSA
jgi:hypothetical protein